jgi:hypothetical protein
MRFGWLVRKLTTMDRREARFRAAVSVRNGMAKVA